MQAHSPAALRRGPSPLGTLPRRRPRVPARAASAPEAPSPQAGRAPPPPQLPGGLPIVGHLLSFLLDPQGTTQAFSNLERTMRRENARMMRVSLLGRVDSVILRHPDDCAAVARDQETFSKAGTGWHRVEAWLGHGLVSDPDVVHHAAVKEVLMPAFKAAAVRGFAPLFEKVGEEMAQLVATESTGGAPYDIKEACRRATLDVIGRAAFGFDFKALEYARVRAGGAAVAAPGAAADAGIGDAGCDVIGVFDEILRPAMLMLFELPIPESMIPGVKGYYSGVKKMNEVVDKIVAAKRAAGPTGLEAGDILGFMLKAQAEGNAVITDQQIRDELNTFMLAGSDTTAATLSFALLELSRRPELQADCAAEAEAALSAASLSSGPGAAAALQAALPLTSAVINETLRLFPAATEVVRAASRDVELGGYFIKKGTFVLPSQYSTQRNPDFWPRPDEFLPERWLPENARELAPHADKAWFPFSAGPRGCIGRFFSLLELQVLLAVLLRRLRFGRVEGYEPVLQQSFTLATAGGALVLPAAR